jgi:hypothetical protein
MKRTWETPKLIVLVRGKPAEGILYSCKGWVDGMATLNTTPYNIHLSCQQVPAVTFEIQNCTACWSLSDS